ncbi:MAG TPA: dihydropteroate synthase [bacterium]|nr:dihydropteroate synthase [bacterium]
MFITVAERINATRKSIREAIETKNEEIIRKEVSTQAESGATMIDINGGTRPEEEKDNLEWLLGIALPILDKPVCIDSANPALLDFAAGKVIELKGIEVPSNPILGNGAPWLMLNSITAEKEKYEGVLPLIHKYNASVVALALDDSGMPGNDDKRILVGRELVQRLEKDGVPNSRVFVDPLVMPVSVNTGVGPRLLRTITQLKGEFPELHFTCGLTNVSYGLPERKLLNRAFLIMMIAAGLDCAILDPTDITLMSSLYAALVLIDQDEFCANYISAFRNNKLDV